MKTTIRTIIAMSLALFALSCAKELEQPKEEASKEETPSEELTSMTFTLAADDASKTALGDDGKSVHFNTGDKISLFDGTSNREFTAKVLADGSVSFLGEAKDIETAQYKALYPYKEDAIVNDGAVEGFCIPAEQTAVKGSFDPKANVSVAYAYEKEGVKYLRFVNVASLAKVVVPATDYKGSTINYAKITIQGNNYYNELTEKYDLPNDKVIAGGNLSVKTEVSTEVVEETGVKKETTIYNIPTEGNKVITLNGPITAGTYYIALYPAQFSDDQGFAIRAYDGNGKIAAFKNTYKDNKFNIAKIKNLGTLNPTVPIPEPLEGVFSVSPTKKVRFAPGNLQYQASTGNWKFAEEQYIAFGDKEEYGNQTPCLDADGKVMDGIITVDGNHFPTVRPVGGRVTQEKWIDLFCYGCTGDATITKKAFGYMPWESWVEPTNNRKYYWTGEELSSEKHTDWGYVVTGTEENPWFTLSSDEWNYLLSSDGTYINGNNAGRIKDGICQNTCLYIRVAVKDITLMGLLLLPDAFEWPAAAGEEPVKCYNMACGNSTYIHDGDYYYYYPIAPDYKDETSAYTMEQYRALEAAGAVFLPTTGFRHSFEFKVKTDSYTGIYIKEYEKLGCYWSRTNLEYPHAMGFYCIYQKGTTHYTPSSRPPRCGKQYASGYDANYRDQGYAVRLVKSCE